MNKNNNNKLTIGEALADLSLSQDKNQKLERELLLAFVLRRDRSFLLLNYQQSLEAPELAEYRRLAKKLLAGWPLAYLIGEREFYGRSFSVNPSTLIPRPESEMIVDIIKKKIAAYPDVALVDIGTGSGCLIISLAAELGSGRKYYGLDISTSALSVAKQNAKCHGVKVQFLESDLLSRLPQQKGPIFLVANLPYLTPEQVRREKSIQKEPKTALISGKDGFQHYRQLFKQLADRQDLKNFFLIIEIDPAQKKIVGAEAKKYWPKIEVEIIKDLRGKNRFAIINGQ